MWVRSSTGGDVLHRNAGEPVHVPIPPSSNSMGDQCAEYLLLNPSNFCIHWLAMTDGQNTSFSTCLQKSLVGLKTPTYKGPNGHWVRLQWKRCQACFAAQATAQLPSQWVSTLYLQRLDQMDVLAMD